ncbi:hypothetical protein CCACVL1_06317 [Corchorus capsularis]|uniref:Uncharacterized protein n=1 Tax=Corchorus capsularis TaxID=210143 RepID=A0A1R3JGA0_COCAP|nr:hypothetical protein CCACVL1_06317 [Corchorus capsularis]
MKWIGVGFEMKRLKTKQRR